MTDPVSYSTATARLGMPMLFSGQSQKEATVNEALALLDVIVSGTVSGVRNAPPASPVIGDAWIVGSTPSGAFAGHSNAVAGWTEGGWRFVNAINGMRIFDLENGAFRHFDGTWNLAPAPVAPIGGAVVDVEARAAIASVIQALKTIGIFSHS